MKESVLTREKARRLSPEQLRREIERINRAIEHPDTQPRERAKHIKRRDAYAAELVIRETVKQQTI